MECIKFTVEVAERTSARDAVGNPIYSDDNRKTWLADYKDTATVQASGKRIGTNDNGRTWFYVDTGKPYQ